MLSTQQKKHNGYPLDSVFEKTCATQAGSVCISETILTNVKKMLTYFAAAFRSGNRNFKMLPLFTAKLKRVTNSNVI